METAAVVGAGTVAPNPRVYDVNGTARPLLDFLGPHLTAFIFVRHLGCIFCREQVKDLRANATALAGAGVQVVIVSPATPQQSAAFARDFAVPFPVLSDPAREAYRAFGFFEGTVGQLLNPHIIARSMQAVARGALPGRRSGNSRQLPGAVLVDSTGTILHLQVATDAADHLMASDVLEIAARVSPRVAAAAR